MRTLVLGGFDHSEHLLVNEFDVWTVSVKNHVPCASARLRRDQDEAMHVRKIANELESTLGMASCSMKNHNHRRWLFYRVALRDVQQSISPGTAQSNETTSSTEMTHRST